MLNTGLMIQTKVNSSTGDVEKLIFDKYLVGKVSEKISDGKNQRIQFKKSINYYTFECFICSCNHQRSFDLHLQR